MNRLECFTGGMAGNSTKLPKYGSKVIGYNPLMWLMALLLAALVTGCGNGSSDPILGGGGNPAAGTLTDTTRPRVTNTVPANLAPAVAANAAITATFTEAMNPATISSPAVSFTLATSAVPAVSVVGTVSYVGTSKIAIFKPTADLTAGTVYNATVTTAATDLAGNALAGNQAALPAASNYVWSFTAAAPDVTSPTITLASPANGATGVSLNISVNATFSEAMDPATLDTTSFTLATSAVPAVPVTGVVTYDLQNNIATFNPSSNLATNTSYTATVTNVATDLAGNALVVPAVGLPSNPWTFTTGTGLAPGAIALGSAGTFGIMATSAITCVPTCIINGDVSLDPGTSITGPPVVNGQTHINDTVSAQARQDLLQAYNQAKTLPPGTIISGGADLGALYISGIPPGTYTSGSTMLVSTPLKLDAGGDSNAVWVFQIGSSFTTSANVTLANGAQSKNVFWVPTSDGTIGVGTTFEGTIVSGRDVTAVTGATINGRILAGAITDGTIALQSGTTVNVPAP